MHRLLRGAEREMRSAAERLLGGFAGFHSVKGSAEATTLVITALIASSPRKRFTGSTFRGHERSSVAS
jgi:hypothetical protein